jgi:putative membrane protein
LIVIGSSRHPGKIIRKTFIIMHGFPGFFSGIFKNKEEIILRDYLALERTKLANERTLLAYSRTSLYMLLGGIAFLQIEGFRRIQWMGYLALGLSVILIFIGLYRFFQIRARLNLYYKRERTEDQQQASGIKENSREEQDINL